MHDRAGMLPVAVRKKSPTLFQEIDRESSEQQKDSDQVAEALRKEKPVTRTISDLVVENAFVAVKESVSCATLKELRERLMQVLPQNSQETRTRYARFVIRWFFPDGIDGIARKTWVAYQDEKILSDCLALSLPVAGSCDGSLRNRVPVPNRVGNACSIIRVRSISLWLLRWPGHKKKPSD